jgi:hypothetical protein
LGLSLALKLGAVESSAVPHFVMASAAAVSYVLFFGQLRLVWNLDCVAREGVRVPRAPWENALLCVFFHTYPSSHTLQRVHTNILES